MTQTSLATAAELDRIAARGWPATDTREIDGWLARAASGVTRRANSVLTVGEVTHADAAIDAAETFYRERGLPVTFQVSDATSPADLADRLAARGYRREGETLAQVALLPDVAAELKSIPAHARAQVGITDEPDPEWITMWWSVDGRGTTADLETARSIMTGAPAIYATIRDETGVSAGGRLAVVGEWGALFSLVVRPNARRQGLATLVLAALIEAAQSRGVTKLCLQVLATSHGALAFYESLGFTTGSHYRYWVKAG